MFIIAKNIHDAFTETHTHFESIEQLSEAKTE